MSATRKQRSWILSPSSTACPTWSLLVVDLTRTTSRRCRCEREGRPARSHLRSHAEAPRWWHLPSHSQPVMVRSSDRDVRGRLCGDKPKKGTGGVHLACRDLKPSLPPSIQWSCTAHMATHRNPQLFLNGLTSTHQ